MAIYPSATPVFDLYEDDDGVYVCEMTPGMVQQLHGLLDAATEMAHEKGRWVPAPIVALTRQLGNAARRRERCDDQTPNLGPDRAAG
jgi:hypothetical protein